MVMNVRAYTMGEALDAAVMSVAYDNGCINRFHSAEDVRIKVRGAVASAFTDAELTQVEEELSRLSPSDRETLCQGEELEAQMVEVSELTRRVLDLAWEAML